MPAVPHKALKTVVSLHATHIIYLKKPGDSGMSPGRKMLSQQIAAGVIVILDTYRPGKRRITAVQEDEWSLQFAEFLVTIQIRIGQGALAGFRNDPPRCILQQFFQNLSFSRHLIFRRIDRQSIALIRKEGADIIDQFRIDMFLLVADKQRYRIAKTVLGQSRGIRTAALTGGDQALRIEQRQCLAYSLPADLILSAKFSLRGQFVNPVLKIGGDQIRQPCRQLLGIFKKIPMAKQIEIADQYIELLQIKTASRETLIKRLSGGNQQKVILARWLATNPDFLILDEPTRGIDIGTKTEIQKLVIKLAQEGKSLIFISSEIEEMLRTCNRMAVLRDGAKVGEISGDEMTQEGVMHAIAGGAAHE